ncbi:MAG: phosphopantothenoylcysteine decarboxylase [Thermoguttaceae bacterium]|nr:phosphopantothenoylcysteine decarboxylase [Thermoguttaceae bacterium]
MSGDFRDFREFSDLVGREVLLGVCGGIAAYKAAALTSLARKAGLGVTVVMTEAATKLVAPKTFEALSGRPVATTMWGPNLAHPHIELARRAEVFCVAPATANTMAKAAAGFADNLMASTILAFAGTLIYAPAMNAAMWEKPATRRNVRQLLEDGALFVGPETGRFSCGEAGVGRMAEPETIFAAVVAALRERAKAA